MSASRVPLDALEVSQLLCDTLNATSSGISPPLLNGYYRFDNVAAPLRAGVYKTLPCTIKPTVHSLPLCFIACLADNSPVRLLLENGLSCEAFPSAGVRGLMKTSLGFLALMR